MQSSVFPLWLAVASFPSILSLLPAASLFPIMNSVLPFSLPRHLGQQLTLQPRAHPIVWHTNALPLIFLSGHSSSALHSTSLSDQIPDLLSCIHICRVRNLYHPWSCLYEPRHIFSHPWCLLPGVLCTTKEWPCLHLSVHCFLASGSVWLLCFPQRQGPSFLPCSQHLATDQPFPSTHFSV